MKISKKLLYIFPVVAMLMSGVCALSFAEEMEDYPVVRLRSLDKVTARTRTFEADVGSTLKFGSLYIKVQACRKAPPVEKPESAAFLQVWEVTAQESSRWVYSGWMFASSPGLSYMDHPIYDVWVLDCLRGKQNVEEDLGEEIKEGEGEVEEGHLPMQPEINPAIEISPLEPFRVQERAE